MIIRGPFRPEKAFRQFFLFFRCEGYRKWMAHADTLPLFLMGAAGDWGYSVEEFEVSPGLYYIDKRTAKLYNTMWKKLFILI
jgi:hypothetical protein